jgi:hypothetical protein
MKSRHRILLFCLLFASCSGTRSKELDKKLTDQPAIQSNQQLQRETDQEIAQDSHLSPDQKAKLEALKTKISSELDQNSKQSLKLRSVLVEELLSPEYSVDEVDLIKSRLKKLEDMRLSLMFDGVDQASSILGRQASQHRQMMNDILKERAIRDHE